MLRRNPRATYHGPGVVSPLEAYPTPEIEEYVLDLYLSIRDGDGPDGRFPGRHLIEAQTTPPAGLIGSRAIFAKHWLASRGVYGPTGLPIGSVVATHTFKYRLRVELVIYDEDDAPVPPTEDTFKLWIGGNRQSITTSGGDILKYQLFPPVEETLTVAISDLQTTSEMNNPYWEIELSGTVVAPFEDITSNSTVIVDCNQWTFELVYSSRGILTPKVTDGAKVFVFGDASGEGWQITLIDAQRVSVGSDEETIYLDVNIEDVL